LSLNVKPHAGRFVAEPSAGLRVNLGGAGQMQHDLIKILDRRDVPTRDYRAERPISSVYCIALSAWQSMPGIR
jgi:hypothetical protein